MHKEFQKKKAKCVVQEKKRGKESGPDLRTAHWKTNNKKEKGCSRKKTSGKSSEQYAKGRRGRGRGAPNRGSYPEN